MKKQDIRNLYTAKVTELLNQGYTIWPDTMAGSQGEIAHIDLSNGSEVVRVLLETGQVHYRADGGYYGEVVRLTVGKAEDDAMRDYGCWRNETIWNHRLETRFQIEFAAIGASRDPWFVDLDEGARICKVQWTRYKAHHTDPVEILPEASKAIALKYIKRQPRMKSCRLEDIEQVQRVKRDDGSCHIEIIAKGKRYTLR